MQAYLAKYKDGPPGKKKKKKKQKKVKNGGNMKIIEMDDFGGPSTSSKKVDDEEDDDAPMIVNLGGNSDDDDDNLDRKQRGAWSTVDDDKDGSDDDLSPPRRGGRVGSDSDDDLSPPRKAGRVGSDSDDDDSDDDVDVPRKGRVDSDDDDDVDVPRKGRVDSDSDDDVDVPRKGRVDSDDDDDVDVPRRGRATVKTEHVKEEEPRVKKEKRRADSDSEEDNKDGVRKKKRGEKMASGHAAGVLTGAQFKQAETKLRAEKKAEMAGIDKDAAGANAATTYRDRKGKKLDIQDELKRVEEEREKKMREEREQFQWGRGTKQKQDEVDARRELKEMANTPFARTADDAVLEKELKGVLRDGDPMAAYFRDKEPEVAATEEESSNKPRYKGPAPPPNRFNLRPGYRWDGIDRSNGFEAKIINKANMAVGAKNDRYNWSCQDM